MKVNCFPSSNSKMLYASTMQVLLIIIFVISTFLVNGEVRYSIPEEMVSGTFVGDIAKDLGLGIQRLKIGKARFYTEGGAEYIELDINKGILFIKDKIDREQMCGKLTLCTLNCQIILENPMELHRVTVDVIDINDNDPTFDKQSIQLKVIESSPPGALFSLPSAIDSDVGTNTIKSYVLTPNDHFKLKSRIQSDSNVYLLLDVPLDREKQEEHFLLLTAIDGGNPQRSGTVEIHIIVLDANDNAPVFSHEIYKAYVQENSLIGSLVMRVSATDADKDMNGRIRYCFSHISENGNNVFEINPDSGEIKVKGHIDYENNKMYEMTVEASDHGGHVSSSKVIIEVIDVNDNVPLINLMSVSNQISEDSKPGTVIAIINVQDKDFGRNGKVNCFVDNNIPFKLEYSLNNFYSLETDGNLDREKVSAYNITIIATDEGEHPLSATRLITLVVSDVNDNPPKFEEQRYSTYIKENNSPGSSFISVRAKDKDSGVNSRISYFVQNSRVNNSSVSSFVSVNSNEGVLYAVRSFDYEQMSNFQVSVAAKDGGSPSLSSVVIIDIYIEDENDNFPEILYPIQNKGYPVAEFIPTSVGVGYLVTKVVAVDKDSQENAWLSYKLIKATDHTLFEVGLHNGEVRTARQIMEKDSKKQKITISVEDSGQPSHSSTININIGISENFALALSEFNDLTKNSSHDANITFYLVLSLALVSFLFLVLIIALICLKIYKWRSSKLFNEYPNETLPVIPYYPPRYADVGTTGTLCHVYNYEVCLTADSGNNVENSDFKPIEPLPKSSMDIKASGTETKHLKSEAEEDLLQVKQIQTNDLTFLT